MVELNWYPSESATDEERDQEVDLAKVDNPGGASWAYVSPENGRWYWEILSAWLWDDAATLARGATETEQEAKDAVSTWVSERNA